MHRLTISGALVVPLLLLLPHVYADCCYSDGNSICADGTNGTPFCGIGKCNLFGCNCDGGCKQQNTAGCIVQAQVTLSSCAVQTVPDYNADPTQVLDACETTYNTAVAACNAASKLRLARDVNAVNGTIMSMDGMFQYADNDRSAAVDITEYLALINATIGGLLTRSEDIWPYLSHFLSFDQDGDLAIRSHEVERS